MQTGVADSQIEKRERERERERETKRHYRSGVSSLLASALL